MRRSASTSVIQTDRTDEKTAELVNGSFTRAKEMMAKAGYKIPDNVRVSVDPQLPFMGYTMPTRQGFNIVIAGGAVDSGMLEGLLVHEMSHIVRISTNHPSHNAEILEEAVERLGGNSGLRDSQQKVIHDLLNDIQDLYADDIAFKVLRLSPSSINDRMTEFLQSWVKDEAVKTKDAITDGWANMSIMAHNARAIAQMARHGVEDTGGRAAHSSRAFLDQVSPDIAKQFDYFRNTLSNLREGMSADEYRALLAKYLGRFVDVAERKQRN